MERQAQGLSLLLIAGLWLMAASTTAQEGELSVPERVRVILPSCTPGPFDRKVFLEVLRLELASHDIALPEKEPPTGWTANDARVAIDVERCSKKASEVRIEVKHLGTQRLASRKVVFALAERDRRARVLALATSTFLTLKWPTLAVDEADVLRRLEKQLAEAEARIERVESRPATTVPSTTSGEAPTRIQPWLVGVGAHAGFFLEFSTATLGPGLWASRELHRHVRLQLAAQGGFGRSRALAGNVKVRLFSGSVGILAGGGNAVWTGVGPRVSAGWVRLRGEAFNDLTLMVEEDRVTSATASLELQVAVRIHLAKRWWAFADALAGYGFRRVDGRSDGDVRGGVGGSTVSLALGVAYGFGK